ncbi:hypothetical protein QYF36_002867 [Acer negundo]|nr:hypothetical protein QYF36_002867 [Acer negundo]
MCLIEVFALGVGKILKLCAMHCFGALKLLRFGGVPLSLIWFWNFRIYLGLILLEAYLLAWGERNSVLFVFLFETFGTPAMLPCMGGQVRTAKDIVAYAGTFFWNSKMHVALLLPLQRHGKNFIGIGAAIRDITGKVVVAISKPLLGNFSVELGELRALREGLLIAKRHNLVIKFAKVNAFSVASMLNLDDPFLGDALFIISCIKALYSKVEGCSCQAIPRSTNSLAHSLAALTFFSGEELFWWDVNPSCIFPA